MREPVGKVIAYAFKPSASDSPPQLAIKAGAEILSSPN